MFSAQLNMKRYTRALLCLFPLFIGSFSLPKYDRENVAKRFLYQTKQQYLQQRSSFLQLEEQMRIGRDITLNADEQKVNQILMNYKQSEINKSRNSDVPFPPSINFLKAKPLVEQSKVFQVIRQMPKGGALHLHDCSMVDLNWLVKNVTYRDNCYMCVDRNYYVYFHFWSTPPHNPDCPWESVKTARANSGNVAEFDQMLYQNMSMIVDDPNKAYPSLSIVWKRFLQTLDQANGLIDYAPVFRDYFYEALQEFCDDNVQYVEFRGLLPETYELSGAKHDQDWALKVYHDIFTQFTREHHMQFSGAKFIYSSIRVFNETVIWNEIQKSMRWIQQYPQHFAGYDLVGQEDPGIPLVDYINALLYPSQQSPAFNLPYFFHAGETDWQGTVTDRNLIDAVLLNTTRIGHGYALVKHPYVMQQILKRDIAIEVNPISNQVLKLVDDLRNHPAAGLIAENFPIVISADDPSVWGARGLSYDFYMAFMALSGETADLRLLKQLAINSIKYSAMKQQEKDQAMNLWKLQWNMFIQKMLHAYNSSPAGHLYLGSILG